jgi:hypothetical protein
VNQIVETIRANSNPNSPTNAEARPVSAAQASAAPIVTTPKSASTRRDAVKARN